MCRAKAGPYNLKRMLNILGGRKLHVALQAT
jgi:hypothetical protein